MVQFYRFQLNELSNGVLARTASLISRQVRRKLSTWNRHFRPLLAMHLPRRVKWSFTMSFLIKFAWVAKGRGEDVVLATLAHASEQPDMVTARADVTAPAATARSCCCCCNCYLPITCFSTGYPTAPVCSTACLPATAASANVSVCLSNSPSACNLRVSRHRYVNVVGCVCVCVCVCVN
jgi:hypothetical protein